VASSSAWRTATTLGGVTGRGFTPGVSVSPGGRPKGLARRVRELVGDNGEKLLGHDSIHATGDL
jgi:hypothetical protein